MEKTLSLKDMLMIVPNTTTADIIAFWRIRPHAVEWHRYPILAWEITDDGDGNHVIEPLCYVDIGHCWCYVKNDTFVFMDGTTFRDFEDVRETARDWFDEMDQPKAS